MKQQTSSQPLKIRVVLEPELEQIARDWPPAKRLRVAAVWERWARQLKVSSFIITSDIRGTIFPRPCMPKIHRRKIRWN